MQYKSQISEVYVCKFLVSRMYYFYIFV